MLMTSPRPLGLRHATRSEIARARTRIRREARARARRLPLERPGYGIEFWLGVRDAALLCVVVAAAYFVGCAVLG